MVLASRDLLPAESGGLIFARERVRSYGSTCITRASGPGPAARCLADPPSHFSDFDHDEAVIAEMAADGFHLSGRWHVHPHDRHPSFGQAVARSDLEIPSQNDVILAAGLRRSFGMDRFIVSLLIADVERNEPDEVVSWILRPDRDIRNRDVAQRCS